MRVGRRNGVSLSPSMGVSYSMGAQRGVTNHKLRGGHFRTYEEGQGAVIRRIVRARRRSA